MNYTSNGALAVPCQMKPARDKQVCFRRVRLQLQPQVRLSKRNTFKMLQSGKKAALHEKQGVFLIKQVAESYDSLINAHI